MTALTAHDNRIITLYNKGLKPHEIGKRLRVPTAEIRVSLLRRGFDLPASTGAAANSIWDRSEDRIRAAVIIQDRAFCEAVRREHFAPKPLPAPEPKAEPVLPMVRGVTAIKPKKPSRDHEYETRPIIRRKLKLPRDILRLDNEWSDRSADVVRPGHRILMEVAEKHQVSIRELRGARRSSHITIARQEACYRLSRETSLSLPQIGKLLDRDHTTVLYSIRKVERMIAEAQKESAA